jgi:adenylosuccinate lyase
MWNRYLTPLIKDLWSEETKYTFWLKVEVAVARAQGALGIIPKTFYKKLEKVQILPQKIHEYEALYQHDVIGFLRSIEDQLPDNKNYLHFGLTSYDIVDTALVLIIQKAIEYLLQALEELKETTFDLAKRYKYQVMIGRTHGIFAQPITLGVKFLSWYSEILRSISRLKKVKETLSYGKISGAVGCYNTVDPRVEKLALKYLGLKPEPVSTQIVPRDRYAEFLCVLAIIAGSLERIATEIRNLQRSEIDELQEPFKEHQRGSSAMPHKRNPIISERICSLARLVRSLAIVGLENIVQWHERDLTNSANERITLPGATGLIHYMLGQLNQILKNLIVKPQNIEKNLKMTNDLYLSQNLMMTLIKKGWNRDEAYNLTQNLSFEALDKNKSLSFIASQHPQIRTLLTPREIKTLFSTDLLKKNVDFIFQRIIKNNKERSNND